MVPRSSCIRKGKRKQRIAPTATMAGWSLVLSLNFSDPVALCAIHENRNFSAGYSVNRLSKNNVHVHELLALPSLSPDSSHCLSASQPLFSFDPQNIIELVDTEVANLDPP